MKQLLLKIVFGVEKKELKKDDLKRLQPLFHKKILKNQKFLKLKSDYKVGYIEIIKSSHIGFLTQIGVRAKDLLIEKKDLHGAKDGDLVIAKRIYKKRGRASAKIVFIAQRKKNIAICYLKILDEKMVAFDIVSNQKISIGIKQKVLKQFPEFMSLKVDIDSKEILEVLGSIKFAQTDEKIVLAKYNKEEDFSKEALKEISSFENFVDKSFYPNRIDLTYLNFITIDPKSAKDFDDAIYFDTKKSILYVAIADVTSYVFPYSALDNEAKRRGFSIYFLINQSLCFLEN